MIAGTASFVKGNLEHLHQTFQVDEFILHTPLAKEEERIRSFQLLSPLHLEEKKISLGKNGEYV